MEYIRYDETANKLYICDKHGEQREELPYELDNELSVLKDKTDNNGDDCNAFQSDAEDLIKNKGYSVKNLDEWNWYKAYYGTN
jgi:hypothetical protein